MFRWCMQIFFSIQTMRLVDHFGFSCYVVLLCRFAAAATEHQVATLRAAFEPVGYN